MSKEICISSTPHETRLAILENEQLTEVYYERENEYTLAGSIYKGRVTRVLPGMQSAFVELGLERDAFLYVTDFMEEQEDSSDFERIPAGWAARKKAQQSPSRLASKAGTISRGRTAVKPGKTARRGSQQKAMAVRAMAALQPLPRVSRRTASLKMEPGAGVAVACRRRGVRGGPGGQGGGQQSGQDRSAAPRTSATAPDRRSTRTSRSGGGL